MIEVATNYYIQDGKNLKNLNCKAIQNLLENKIWKHVYQFYQVKKVWNPFLEAHPVYYLYILYNNWYDIDTASRHEYCSWKRALKLRCNLQYTGNITDAFRILKCWKSVGI